MSSVLLENRYANPALLASYESAGKRCGQLVIALGSAVLIGWITGIVALTRIVPQWMAMQPNTAFCFVLAGISVLAAGTSRGDPRSRLLQLGCASVVLMVGLVTLLEYALGVPLGIDQLLHSGSPMSGQRAFPGRMAVATASTFMLVGAALATIDTAARRLSQLLALLAMAVATLAILGYAYGVSALYDLGFFATIALHTAVATLVVSTGILLVRPARGVVAVLVSSTVGGVLARRLLPFAVATPLILGWLRIAGERHHLYDSSFGVALTALSYVILFGIFAWRTAEALRRSDDLRLDAEHVQETNQAQMSGLIESAMDAIVMLDDAQNIIVFNPAAEKMFGYQRADILGSPLSKLLPQRFRAAHGGQLRAFGSAGSASRRMGSLGPVAALRADGTEFPVEASISQFDLGHGAFYTAIVRDITERTRIEAELHASEQRERERSQELSNLLFAVPAAVCIAHDAQLTELTGNELYDRWLRASQADLSPSKGAAGNATPTPSAHQLDDDLHSGHAAMRQAAAGVEIRDYEFKHVHPNGSIRYLFGNAMPLWDEQGRACGAISAFVDVTELKLAEQEMLTVTAASVAKSDYITHMTHELRTPLNTMLGYAQMLETGTLAPNQLAGIKQIIKAGWYLRDLITEVQDLAIIEANSASLSWELVSVDALLDDLHDDQTASARCRPSGHAGGYQRP